MNLYLVSITDVFVDIVFDMVLEPYIYVFPTSGSLNGSSFIEKIYEFVKHKNFRSERLDTCSLVHRYSECK